MVLDHQPQKIKRIVPHLVVGTFLFLVIVISFLGYVVYENSSLDKPGSGSKGKVLGDFDPQAWTQDDFTGGISGQTGTMNWDPGLPTNWKKYSTATNITQDLVGIKATAPGSTLTSSILDQGPTYRTRYMGFTTDTYPNTTTTVHVRGANSEGGIGSAAWELLPDGDFQAVCLGGVRYMQYKVQFAQTNDPFYNFWALAAKVQVTGNTGLGGVTITANGNSTTTNTDGSYNLEWWYKTTNATNFSVSASKTGYKSQTKTATINPAACDWDQTINFTLEKTSSSDSSGSSDTSSTSSSESATSSEVPTTTTDSITKVVLPSIFTKKGSETTDLSKIKDPKNVKNLTLEVVGKGKIVFKDPVDLSAKKTIAAFEQLNKYLIIGSGYVDLSSKILSALDKKATIVMYELTHLFEPEVLIDGKKDTKKVVSNVVYDEKTGTLTFDVAHFSKIVAVPKIELLEPAVDKVENPNALIKGRVSDPNATLTARFNEQDIESINVDLKSGEFTLEGVIFREGENFLTIEAESKIGKVLPLVKTIIYQPTTAAVDVANQTNYPLLIVSLIVLMIFLMLAGYLIYRKRKHKSPPKQVHSAR